MSLILLGGDIRRFAVAFVPVEMIAELQKASESSGLRLERESQPPSARQETLQWAGSNPRR